MERLCARIPVETPSVEIAINQTRSVDLFRANRKEEGEKEPREEKARSVVTLDDNLSGRSGSLRDLDTKISLCPPRDALCGF